MASAIHFGDANSGFQAERPETPRQQRYENYTVGWICALPVELAAAQEMLDEEHDDLERDENDENVYSLGSIGGHNVVIVCLPAGRIGNNPAVAVATQMRATFRGIRVGLLVGIGGGVPSAEDVRLGDVVVSQPDHTFGGVIQYDLGKATPSGFERTGSLNSPPQVLLGAVAKVRANDLRGRSKLSEHVSKLSRIPKFRHDNAGPDVLFEATYNHAGGQTCDLCDVGRQEHRQPRENEDVVVHYGTIASGNQVMRDGCVRDMLSSELGGILCFEMEAAGLMNSFPCLIIRGICDYADSHKNKRWQAYAAGTAAAYAKEVLLTIPPKVIAKSRTADEITRQQIVERFGVRIRATKTIRYITHLQWLGALGDLSLPFRQPKLNMEPSSIDTYVESWMNLVEMFGAESILSSRYVSTKTVGPEQLPNSINPFGMDLSCAALFAGNAGCHSFSMEADCPVFRSETMSLTCTKGGPFGMTGRFTREVTLGQRYLPVYTSYDRSLMMFSANLAGGCWWYRGHKVLTLIDPEYSVSIWNELLCDLREGSCECDRKAEILSNLADKQRLVLSLLAADTPWTARVFPGERLKVQESVLLLSQLCGLWKGNPRFGAIDVANSLGSGDCTFFPLKRQDLAKLPFSDDRIEERWLRLEIFEGCTGNPVLLGFSWLCEPESYVAGNLTAEQVLSGLRLPWPMSLSEHQLVIIEGMIEACGRYLDCQEFVVGETREESYFFHLCVSCQLQEVDWWLRSHKNLAACETTHLVKILMDSGLDDRMEDRALVRWMLVFRSILVAMLLAMALDNSLFFRTDLGSKLVLLE